MGVFKPRRVLDRGESGSVRRLRMGLLATVLCVTSALGCTSMGSIEPLEVTLADLNVTEVTVFETTLVAKLRITNPNPEPFTIDGGSFKLYLEDKKVGTGTTKETFTVDRLDSSVVDVLFHLNNASALLRLKDILEAEGRDISYGVRGALFTQGTYGTTKLKVEKTGTIDLTGAKPTESDRPDLNHSASSGSDR